MISFLVYRLMFLILLGSLTLIKRADSDSNDKFGRVFTSQEARKDSLNQIFALEEGSVDAMKNLIYDGNIQKVVNILQNNVKQWSFIESQLLEPNVNIGMPEIFIPLKHLTTALELLGNVFVSRNEYSEARECLERACPLMELLPSNVLESDSANEIPTGKTARNIQINKNKEEPKQNQYAANCFSLLKEVYLKIYDQAGRVAESIISGAAVEEAEKYEQLFSEVRPSVVFVPVDHQLNKKTSTSAAVIMTTEFLDPSKKPGKLQSIRMSKANSLSTFLASNRVAVASPSSDSKKREGDWLDDESDFYVDESSSGSGLLSGSNVDWISQKFKDLRIPFDHLRNSNQALGDPDLDALRQLMKQGNSGSSGGSSSGLHHSFILKQQRKNSADSPDAGSSSGDDSLSDKAIKNILFGSGALEELVRETSVGSKGNKKRSAQSNHGNVVPSTSMLASDLEDLLRKFISGDKAVKSSVIKRARAYYEELDLQFPEMTYSEYSANMNLGQVFIDVMTHINEEGIYFISNELIHWSENNGGVKVVDEQLFGSITVNERNRLLVLSAFDVAYSLAEEDGFDDPSYESLDIYSLFELATTAAATASNHASLLQRTVPVVHSRKSKAGSKDSKKAKKKSTKTSEASEEPSASPSNTVNSATLNRLEREVTAALYEELLGTVDIATLRSSVPMLNADNDWTLFIFYLVVIISVVIVVQLLYADSQKKKTRLRQRTSTQKKPVSGVPFVDNILHYFQPDEVEASEGQSSISSQTGSVSGLSAVVSSSSPTSAAAIDAFLSIWTLCLYLSRIAMWVLTSGLNHLVVWYKKNSSANNNNSNGNSNVQSKGRTAPGTSTSSAAAKPDVSSYFQSALENSKNIFARRSAEVHEGSSNIALESSDKPSEHIDQLSVSVGAPANHSAATSPLKSRGVSDSALDESLVAAFASEASNNKSHHKKQSGVSFSSNLIAPSVHVAAKNSGGVVSTTKKGSALKHTSTGKHVPTAIIENSDHSESSASAPQRENDESKHRVVSKIAGKTIPMESLGASDVNTGDSWSEGEFITVNKEKRSQKEKIVKPAHSIPAAAPSVRPTQLTNYARKPTIDVSQFPQHSDDRKASSLPNTPLYSNGHSNGKFFPENTSVSASKALPPPPPLRTVNKVSPELKGIHGNSRSSQPQDLLLPPMNDPGLQSLDFNLLGSLSTFSGSSNSNNGLGFGLPMTSDLGLLNNFSPSKPSIAPPPGIGASNLFSNSNSAGSSILSNTSWSIGSKSPYLDDFEYDNSIIEATDAFLDGLNDYVQSPIAPRSNPIPASNVSVVSQSYSANTSTALHSLTPPVRPKQSSALTNTSSITIEAMYDGLSPDAPSFQPGMKYASSKIYSTGYDDYSAVGTAGNQLGFYSQPAASTNYDGYYEEDSQFANELYDNLMSDLDGVVLDSNE